MYIIEFFIFYFKFFFSQGVQIANDHFWPQRILEIKRRMKSMLVVNKESFCISDVMCR